MSTMPFPAALEVNIPAAPKVTPVALDPVIDAAVIELLIAKAPATASSVKFCPVAVIALLITMPPNPFIKVVLLTSSVGVGADTVIVPLLAAEPIVNCPVVVMVASSACDNSSVFGVVSTALPILMALVVVAFSRVTPPAPEVMVPPASAILFAVSVIGPLVLLIAPVGVNIPACAVKLTAPVAPTAPMLSGPVV